MRSGSFAVWYGDDYYTVLWSVVSRGEAVWFEATISNPQVGPQGTELDPIVDITVTKGRREWCTVGAFDGDTGALAEAVMRTYRIAAEELDHG